MATKIAANVKKIKQQIVEASADVNRDPEDICPIVVTKNRTEEEIETLYQLGFRHFAENRAEKLLERQAAFPQTDIVWHLIGPLQKRKVKTIIDAIHYFHAVDRLSILDEIEKRSTQRVKVFVEVNVSGEVSKHGFTMEQCLTFFPEISSYHQIEVVGLMTMAPFAATTAELNAYFNQLNQLAKTIETTYRLEKKLLLSMGMSNDFEEAIRNGATHVRIGTAWFE